MADERIMMKECGVRGAHRKLKLRAALLSCHCEERSDVAISQDDSVSTLAPANA